MEIVSHRFTPVREPCIMHWLFLGFLSFFPVASPPHSVLEGCADPSGSLNKQELRAGCHHPCSFSAHSCWGTIHQANRLEEVQELSELPMWNKSYYWMRTSHTHFFSTSLLGQSLQSFSMEQEVVGFSATFWCWGSWKWQGMWGVGLLRPWQEMPRADQLSMCWLVWEGIIRNSVLSSTSIWKEKKKILAFYNLEQASTSLYVIPYLRITLSAVIFSWLRTTRASVLWLCQWGEFNLGLKFWSPDL